MTAPFDALLDNALIARASLFDERHEGALRLFNGFVEGIPRLVVDLYGKTLVINDHDESERGDEAMAQRAFRRYVGHLPWITSALWKVRSARSAERRYGVFLLGDHKQLTRRIKEAGVTYALVPNLNRDASFYLDTRGLRAWAKANLGGKKVLNTFAYTSSLGVAARAAGAEVVHTDLNRRFLNVAKDSYTLNGWEIVKPNFKTGDFFEVVGQLKRDERLFDCIFVDPPFFSVTGKGEVDLQANADRVLNKVRPLIGHGGALVVVNNALFRSGADHLKSLQAMCSDGYLSIEEHIAIPEDTVGFPTTRVGTPKVDPAPFNHATKISVLRVTRKDGRMA